MATSPLEGRLLTGRTWDADAAVDACFTRDFILNNLCHYADEFAQVRAAWSATAPPYDPAGGEVPQALPGDGGENDTWVRIYASHPFPLALRENGDGYRIRLRIAGATEEVSGTTTYRVVVCPPSLASTLFLKEDDYVWEGTTTSTSVAWLTGASQGSLALTTQVHIGADVAAAWVASTDTLTAIGGNNVAMDQCLVSVNVFGKHTLATPTGDYIKLYGIYAAEFIG